MTALSLAGFLFVSSLSIAKVAATGEGSAISPTLRPNSNFGKDYPVDARPKLDVFHFHHPYPAVQDSDDFDNDFVKDENNDNGNYQAQMEYDRLRHKLAKEKAEVAKAMEEKTEAENELRGALARKKAQEDAMARKKAEEEAKRGSVSAGKGLSDGKENKIPEGPKRDVAPEYRTPGGTNDPGHVKVASGDLEQAMRNLEKCKEDLAEARDKLKKVVAGVDDAKAHQDQTQATLDAAIERKKTLEAAQKSLEGPIDREHKEYLEAKKAFEKQEAILEKLEVQIKAAAAKVDASRRAEDNGPTRQDGGVYQTKKSGAPLSSIAPLVALTLALGTVLLH